MRSARVCKRRSNPSWPTWRVEASRRPRPRYWAWFVPAPMTWWAVNLRFGACWSAVSRPRPGQEVVGRGSPDPAPDRTEGLHAVDPSIEDGRSTRPVWPDGQLHRTGPFPDRPPQGFALTRAARRIRPAHRSGPLRPARRADRPCPPAGQRRRQLHHRHLPHRRRRLPCEDLLSMQNWQKEPARAAISATSPLSLRRSRPFRHPRKGHRVPARPQLTPPRSSHRFGPRCYGRMPHQGTQLNCEEVCPASRSSPTTYQTRRAWRSFVQACRRSRVSVHTLPGDT